MGWSTLYTLHPGTDHRETLGINPNPRESNWNPTGTATSSLPDRCLGCYIVKCHTVVATISAGSGSVPLFLIFAIDQEEPSSLGARILES